MATEKGKRRKKPPKRDDPRQSRKFIEAAKKLGLGTTSSREFDDLFRKVVKKDDKDGSS